MSPRVLTLQEKRENLVARLRAERLELQRVIADETVHQQRIYAEVLKPSAAAAKLLTSAVLGSSVPTRSLAPQAAAFLEGSSDPTSRFEWARSEIDRLSTFIRSKRTRLKKVEAELEKARASLGGETDDDASGSHDGGADRARAGAGVPGYLGERVDALATLVAHARGGGRGL